MRISNAHETTLLPPPPATNKPPRRVPRLAPLCAVRMAAADRAEEEFADLCEEVSRVHRRPRSNADRNPTGR